MCSEASKDLPTTVAIVMTLEMQLRPFSSQKGVVSEFRLRVENSREKIECVSGHLLVNFFAINTAFVDAKLANKELALDIAGGEKREVTNLG